MILGPGSSVDIKYRPLSPGVCVMIAAESQIFGRLIIQRPGSRIIIGKRTYIGASSLIAAHNIEIGDDVLMAWGITLMDNDSHSLEWASRKNDVIQHGVDYRNTPEDSSRNKNWSIVPMAPIKVKDKAWIGFGATILKGITIGEGAIIGAMSVVTKDVPPYTLVAGNPARAIRELSENE